MQSARPPLLDKGGNRYCAALRVGAIVSGWQSGSYPIARVGKPSKSKWEWRPVSNVGDLRDGDVGTPPYQLYPMQRFPHIHFVRLMRIAVNIPSFKA